LFAAVSELAASRVDVAFLDLAGFRAFNNAHGQDAGDAVLAELAAALREIPSAAVVRDGGDEFLVVGAPTRDRLTRHSTSSVARGRHDSEIASARGRPWLRRSS
jgi:diguanylate cyclase (GGDEF)-like protein